MSRSRRKHRHHRNRKPRPAKVTGSVVPVQLLRCVHNGGAGFFVNVWFDGPVRLLGGVGDANLRDLTADEQIIVQQPLQQQDGSYLMTFGNPVSRIGHTFGWLVPLNSIQGVIIPLAPASTVVIA